MEEPPEDTHFRPQRVCLALTLQIVARYFFEEDSQTSSMKSKLRSFRESGGECFLVLMITDSHRYSLTNGDKQFACWTLREVIVSSYQSDPSAAKSLLRWLVWLLGCPATNCASTMMPSGAQVKPGSLDNVLVDRETRRMGERNDIIYAIPPSGQPVIPHHVRMFVVQELRFLLGGDDWSPIWDDASITGVQNKIYCMGRWQGTSDGKLAAHDGKIIFL